MAPKLDALAKLYLESPPTAIPPETQAELCAFIMAEFQELPFSAEFSDFKRYDNADEMFADIEQGHLWVEAESYDADLYGNPFYGFAFLAEHDYSHYLCQSNFSLEGEITAYKTAACRVHPDFAMSTNAQQPNLRKSRTFKSYLKLGLARLGCTQLAKLLA